MITIKRVGKSKFAEQIDKFTKISNYRAEIGWNDSLNASKAYLQENGGISSNGKAEVPPRPFIYPAIIEKENEGVSLDFINLIKSKKIFRAFLHEAKTIKELIQSKIDSLKFPSLAKKTIKLRKEKGPSHYVAGLEKPLIETGEMRNSIEIKVI